MGTMNVLESVARRPAPGTSGPRAVGLDVFVARLREACAPVVRAAAVGRVLEEYRPSLASLHPWIAFTPERYTRQRLFRCPSFEVLLLCWSPGQATPIHDHDGQDGWFSVIEGALTVQEYGRAGAAPLDLAPGQETAPGAVHLTEGVSYRVPAGTSVAEAAGPETIHRVGVEGGRALSLHVYAGPLESFVVFDRERGTARRFAV